MPLRLVGKAKAKKIKRHHPVSRRQIRPHRQPVEAGGRKAVEQEERRRGLVTAGADEDLMTVPCDVLAVCSPLGGGLRVDSHGENGAEFGGLVNHHRNQTNG